MNSNGMNSNILNTFYHRIKQTSENHKPYRHRKSHAADEELIANMKIKMAQRKKQEKHKRVISQARKRRAGHYDTSQDNEDIVLNEKVKNNDEEDFLYMDPEMMGL